MRFGVFIYNGVEPIDLATYGVLSMARRIAPEISLLTIAPEAGEVRLANGLRVIADHGIADAPARDVVIVTGGPGWVEQAASAPTLAYLRAVAATTRLASVCTGAMILAASGVLDGSRATTKRETVPPEIAPLTVMTETYPAIAARAASLVDDGGVITGGGVSLCIDTTLHILATKLGPEIARETARILEYDRAWAANLAGFPPLIGGGA
jgi:transcriptional regulator GlxA family with amidase domain